MRLRVDGEVERIDRHVAAVACLHNVATGGKRVERCYEQHAVGGPGNVHAVFRPRIGQGVFRHKLHA